MKPNTAPSSIIATVPLAATTNAKPTLTDLMYDGFYALFMLKNGNGPLDDTDLINKMTLFVEDFGRAAKKQHASSDDIDAAKYAFCAAVDETILSSAFPIRSEWERRPLQLIIFDDQLAGVNFFVRLKEVRLRGAAHVQALEVFHMCLLLGFQGRYRMESVEDLNYITSRLGDEIAHIKGKSAAFAPHAEPPDRIINKLRNDPPLWIICSVFLLICTLAYVGMRGWLDKTTQDQLKGYNSVVKLAPRQANLTITLP